MEFHLDQAAIDAIFDLPDGEGGFTPARTAYLQQLGARRPLILLAFPPKAGGTFLRQVLADAIEGQVSRIVHAQAGRDAQPYLPTFLAYYHGGITEGPLVAHVHMLGLTANLRFVEVFGLRPVIMLRSIPDMLASYWDMLDKEPGAVRQGLNCAVPRNWQSMEPADKADFLIDVLGPWYANFFGTWLDYAAQPGNHTCVLTYGEFLGDALGTLQKILRHSGISASPDECRNALGQVWSDRANFRFNQGREGRGVEYFSPSQIDRLGRMLSYYKPVHARLPELLGR